MDISKLTKDQKLEVMHVGLCTIFVHMDIMSPWEEIMRGGVHFKTVKNFNLTQLEQGKK